LLKYFPKNAVSANNALGLLETTSNLLLFQVSSLLLYKNRQSCPRWANYLIYKAFFAQVILLSFYNGIFFDLFQYKESNSLSSKCLKGKEIFAL